MNSGSSETYLSKILESCTRGKRVKVAVCTLNQWAMDFETNKNNILESLEIARANGCRVRVGPELEIPGYGCEDHFLELDTVEHSWQVLGEILLSGLT